MKFVDINSLSQFLNNLKGIFEPKGSSNTAINTAKTYTDTTASSHNTSTDAHANMGWLSSEDEIADSPTTIDADTLNGRNAAYFDNQIAVERARINQFVALEDGSTTGDAELQNIRIGYDGTVYESAGDAVRGQVNSALVFKPQAWTEEQKAQARVNIGAVGEVDIESLVTKDYVDQLIIGAIGGSY